VRCTRFRRARGERPALPGPFVIVHREVAAGFDLARPEMQRAARVRVDRVIGHGVTSGSVGNVPAMGGVSRVMVHGPPQLPHATVSPGPSRMPTPLGFSNSRHSEFVHVA
jgi:hypothetical protein